MARDPWDEFALVGDEPTQPAQQGMATAPVEGATPMPGAPAIEGEWGEFAPAAPAFAEDANLIDSTQTIGGFADELPQEIASQLKPEQIAQWEAILKPGVTPQQLSDTMRSFGFDLANAEDVATSLASGTPVNRNFKYELPKVESPKVNVAALGPVAHVADTAARAVFGDGATDSFERGAIDTWSMGTANKFNAATQAVADVFAGHGEWGDRYDANLDYENAVEGNDERDHPYARIAGQLTAGMALPTGMPGVGARAGALAMRAARAGGATFDEAMLIGRAAAAKAVRERMAKEGAGYGGAYGVGSGDTLDESATGGVTGAVVGAVGGTVLGGAAEKIAPKLVARAAATRALPVSDGQQVIAAADRIGMDVLPADVGGAVTRRATGAGAQFIGSAGPIVSAARRVIEQGKAVRDRVASTLGAQADPELAGERAIEGATTGMRQNASRIGRIYDAADRMAGGARLPLTNAKATLDEQIARLREVPGGGAGLKEAEDLRKGLDGDFTVQGIRDMRTEMFVAPDFRGTPVERRLKQIVGAAADDIHDGLIKAGKTDAAQAFRAADDKWKAHIKTIERVIEPIIGKAGKERSGEEVVAGLERAMKGGGRRFEAFLNALPGDEQGMVRATLIGRMGRKSAGAQDAEGAGFSLDQFLTHWNTIGERSKAATFGVEGRSALNDLARVAQGAKEAGRYANHSNTGGAIGNLATGATLAIDVFTLGKTLAVQYGAGKLLASPRFARWLARAPKTSLGQRAYVERLGRIARAEPAIAQDVLSLQSRLLEAFEPARLAADDTTDRSQSR